VCSLVSLGSGHENCLIVREKEVLEGHQSCLGGLFLAPKLTLQGSLWELIQLGILQSTHLLNLDKKGA